MKKYSLLTVLLIIIINANGIAAQTDKMGIKDSPYLHPYSFNHHSPSGIRWDKLGINTGYIGGSSVLFMGVIYAFPVNISNWYDRTISLKNYWKHIQIKPAVDKDDWVINGLGHGLLGAYYYSSARSAGLSAWGSLLYTTFISTFAWEYGIEAIMEIPSLQDLILTPTVGAVLGEGFYAAKRSIVRNNYRVGSSRFFGCLFAFILDPLGELTDYATKEHFIFYNKVVPRAKKKVNMSLQMTSGGLYFSMNF
ncbi:MAG: DUF3943 domain-containing protein [Bacteroidales bacterium]|jgi:hypothetical protein|nr:DUF3943 domain-containing protein [Bacteroidales bacterium]